MRKTKTVLGATTVALVASVAAAAVPAAALAVPSPAAHTVQKTHKSQKTQAHLTLPQPTGPYQVGTVSLPLTDRSRANPWTSSPPDRELMVSVWYPARDAGRYPRAPQMLPAAAAHFGSADGAAPSCTACRRARSTGRPR